MTTVWCKTRFESIHSWPKATGDISYLKDKHRHIFHVKLEVRVSHTDREVEFITLKHGLTEFCNSRFFQPHTHSCEDIAGILVEEFKKKYVVMSIEVSEDDENGATWYNGDPLEYK